MVDAVPTRLRLSRAPGFNLQAHSTAINGLSAQNVARPTMWGNPFMVDCYGRDGAVDRFRRLVCGTMSTLDMSQSSHWGFGSLSADARRMRKLLPELRGKNLACWCPLECACHADVLLDLANAGTPHA